MTTPDVLQLAKEADQDHVAAMRAMLVARREELGITPTEVADRMGAGSRTVAAIEAGRNQRILDLSGYARAIGGRLTLLIDYPEDPCEAVWCPSCKAPLDAAPAESASAAAS